MSQELRLTRENGKLFFDVDNSTLSSHRSCARKGFHKTILQRGGPRSSALCFGSAFHKAMEQRLLMLHAGTLNGFMPWFQDNVNHLYSEAMQGVYLGEKDHRTLANLEKLVTAYHHQFPTLFEALITDNDGNPIIERAFEVPLHTYTVPRDVGVLIRDTRQGGYMLEDITCGTEITVRLTGKIDFATWTPAGMPSINDFKTTSMLGTTYGADFQMSNQFSGYAYAFHVLTGLQPAVYTIHACCLTKTGNITFETLPFPINWELLNESLQSTRQLANTILDNYFHDEGAQPNFDACVGKYGKCEYFSACQVGNTSMRYQMLASPPYVDLTWDPRDE